jgi:hypothetical protein
VAARRDFRGPENVILSRPVRPRLITVSTDCQCFKTVDEVIDGPYAANAPDERPKIGTAGYNPSTNDGAPFCHGGQLDLQLRPPPGRLLEIGFPASCLREATRGERGGMQYTIHAVHDVIAHIHPGQ